MTKLQLQAENKALKLEVEQKQFIIAKLQKMLFGPKAERFVPEVPANQLSLFEEEQKAAKAAAEAAEKQVITYQRNKPGKKQKPSGRIPLPEHLPRIKVVLEPEEATEELVKIGEEVTEILDIIPPVFQVIQLIRPKYAKPEAKTEEVENPILIAPLPKRAIDKGIPSARLLAYILISKFIDHLPYYRQIKQFQRVDIQLNAKTINAWIAKVCVLLKPLYDAFCKHQFSKAYLQGDETTIKVLNVEKKGQKNKKGKPPKRRAHTGYYWVYYDPIDNQAVFLFDLGRGRVYPSQHLRDFSGKLQTDGLRVYDAFDDLEHMVVLGCMVHVRRKFVDALDNDRIRAEKILTFIQALYALEEKARKENYSCEQRLELRQQDAAPIMEQLKSYLDSLYDSGQILPKSALGQAIHYALGRWKYVERYLEDGKVEIDNNLVENAIRPVALGRKNYLFAGSEEGAKWGAIIYTLLSSAIRQRHNPLNYLADVLRRLPGMKLSELDQLFPHNWKPKPESDLDLI